MLSDDVDSDKLKTLSYFSSFSLARDVDILLRVSENKLRKNAKRNQARTARNIDILPRTFPTFNYLSITLFTTEILLACTESVYVLFEQCAFRN